MFKFSVVFKATDDFPCSTIVGFAQTARSAIDEAYLLLAVELNAPRSMVEDVEIYQVIISKVDAQ